MTKGISEITCFLYLQIDSRGCHPYEHYPSPLFQSVFGIIVIFVEFFLPILILIYCYARIFWVLRQRIGSKMNSKSTASVKLEKATKNVIKTLLIVAFCFFLCFSNNQIYYLLYNLGVPNVHLRGTYYTFTVLMMFLNCTINPFIYLANYQDFQKGLRKLLCDCYAVDDEAPQSGSRPASVSNVSSATGAV